MKKYILAVLLFYLVVAGSGCTTQGTGSKRHKPDQECARSESGIP